MPLRSVFIFKTFVKRLEMFDFKNLLQGVKMLLARNPLMIFLSTYLPTILMNLINQSTNYLTVEDKYSLVLTTNITCMMVLASVYLSVSSGLPTTLTIKPVEVWLLFNLSYPVLVILVNVLLQVRMSWPLSSTKMSFSRLWKKGSGIEFRKREKKYARA